MIGDIYQFDDLRKICRRREDERPTLATVERWAQKIGLQYNYDGDGGIWTTKDALNAAVGLRSAASDSASPYTPDMVV